MTGILSSARMRRRLVWGGIFALIAAAVAGLIVAFPSPKPGAEERISNQKSDIVRIPKESSFAPRSREIYAVAQHFVLTAVRRRHLEEAWNLAAPELKEGLTKKKWLKGTIPVVPFPVHSDIWELGYSYEDEVGLRVAFFPRPESKVRPMVFDMTLKRFTRHGHDRWLVASITPAPSASGDFGESSRDIFSGRNRATAADKVKVETEHNGAIWLLVPGGVLALLLVVLAGVGIRSWRSAALYKAYVRERQSSSSSPS